MFHAIPAGMQARMLYLEEIDAADRADGTPQARRLRQIPRETGRLLAILAAAAPKGSVIEIGTSAGYSTMWLSLGCKVNGGSITTFEILPEKASLARETFRLSGIDGHVTGFRWLGKSKPANSAQRISKPASSLSDVAVAAEDG